MRKLILPCGCFDDAEMAVNFGRIRHGPDCLSQLSQGIGGLTLKLDRLVKVTPHENGALLVVGTLPRATSMGMDATLDAKEFMDLAALVENAL